MWLEPCRPQGSLYGVLAFYAAGRLCGIAESRECIRAKSRLAKFPVFSSMELGDGPLECGLVGPRRQAAGVQGLVR